MKKYFSSFLFFAMISLITTTSAFCFDAGTGDKDFDVYLSKLNIEAKANVGDYQVKLGAEFGTSKTEVGVVLKAVDEPADAYMVLKISRIAGISVDAVLKEYKAGKGKGWGVIAKNLGIKPGSPAFHELKKTGAKPSKSENKGKGKKK